MRWDALNLLLVVVTLTGLVEKRYLPPQLAAILLVALALFRAFARATGGVTGCLYRLFQIFFYGMLVVAVVLRGGIAYTMPILIGALGGGFEHIVSKIITLAAQGYVPVIVAVIAIVALVGFRRLGLEMASVFLYHTVFTYLAPLFAFVLLISHWGDWRQMVLIGVDVLGILLMLESLYIIAFGGVSEIRR